MMRLFLFFCAIATSLSVNGQQHSHNGWALPVKDTLRVLMLFVEVNYDTLAHLEHLPEGKPEWPKGDIPAYADSIFHPFRAADPSALVTRYYHESSLGNFTVLGDYINHLFTVPYSLMMTGGQHKMFSLMAAQLASMGEWQTNAGLRANDFDFWELSQGRGFPVPPSQGKFSGVDHVMVLTRNYHAIPKDNGQASFSSFGIINGTRTDTYSIFSGGHGLPFGILKHELNHLFLGGNNFHSGGGNSSRFLSYTIYVQGGWSMMGAANSSLLTCNGWDRYRLGWKAAGNQHIISARSVDGTELNADLDALNPAHQGVYVIRDFQTTGDALRIKLPFIPDHQFQQWLWLESHGTKGINGSPFDEFQFSSFSCKSQATPGIYAAVQIDAENKEGKDVFNAVLADYWKPLPANGCFDFSWSAETVQLEPCVNSNAYPYYELLPQRENPLSGNHEQETAFVAGSPDAVKIMPENMATSMIRKNGNTYDRLNFLGANTHAFTKTGNAHIGIGTNPASASVLTMVNARIPKSPDNRNNDTIYLSGVSVTVIEQFTDGSAKVRVVFDDHLLSGNRRWCAPTIVLNNHRLEGADLTVTGKLTLCQGTTATRFDRPRSFMGVNIFTDPTMLIINPLAGVHNRGWIRITDGSVVIFSSGSELLLEKRSTLEIDGNSKLVMKPGSVCNGKGKVKISRDSKVQCSDQAQYDAWKRRIRRRSLVLIEGG